MRVNGVNQSAIDASRPLFELPTYIPEHPAKAPMLPPVLALAICRGGDLGIDILADRLSVPNATPKSLSLSRDLVLVIVGVKASAPSQAWERGWEDSNDLRMSVLR